MLVMDRENPLAAGWSHVLSTAATPEAQRAELETFRVRIGAPRSAHQGPTRTKPRRHVHLDLRAAPRRAALALDGTAVRVYDSARQMVRDLRALRADQGPTAGA